MASGTVVGVRLDLSSAEAEAVYAVLARVSLGAKPGRMIANVLDALDDAGVDDDVYGVGYADYNDETGEWTRVGTQNTAIVFDEED